jgi:hypothetical protein
MTSSRLSAGFIGITVVLAASLAEAGDEPESFKATVAVNETLTPTPTPGVLLNTLAGTGKGAHLGRLTLDATETIDFTQFFRPDLFPAPRTLVTSGQLTLTGVGGAKIFATYSGYGVPDPARPGFFNGFATATLTGGTGRFHCAAGTVPFTLDINVAANTEVITFDGHASFECDDDE